MATKKAQPTLVVEDDDIEELDELEEAAAASEVPAKKTRKAKVEKPTRAGFSTKEAAELLGITPVRLRRILRSEDGGFQDKEYTKYDLSQADLDRVAELLKAGTAVKAEKSTKPKKSKKAKVEEAAAEVTDELEDLADLADDDEEVATNDEDEDDDLDLDDEDEEE